MEKQSKNRISKYFLYALLVFSGFITWYIGTAFVKYDINARNWGEGERSLVVIEGLLTSIVVLIAYMGLKKE